MTIAKKIALATAALLAPALSLSPARAQQPAQASGAQGEMLFWITDAEKKLEELAAATPEAKFAWRPAKDVRSTGEVFVHVAQGNYGIARAAGVKPPEGINLETFAKTLTKKADIEKAMKDSFAHVKTAFAAMSAADLDKPTDLFGNKTTNRGVYMLVLAHAHEHLGQSIAYARMNKITPPWTAERMRTRTGAGKTAAKAE